MKTQSHLGAKSVCPTHFSENRNDSPTREGTGEREREKERERVQFLGTHSLSGVLLMQHMCVCGPKKMQGRGSDPEKKLIGKRSLL